MIKDDIELAQDVLVPPTMEAEQRRLRDIFEERKKMPNTDYTNFLGRYKLKGSNGDS